MRKFENDRHPRGKLYKGTKESLHEAGTLLKKLAISIDESEKDGSLNPKITELDMLCVKNLLDNVSHDDIFNFNNIVIDKK
jgi:hypothetical protein